jgi:hypothetical protein
MRIEIGNWQPSKTQVMAWLRVAIAVCGAVLTAVAAHQLVLPAWLIGVLTVVVSVLPVVLNSLSNNAVQEANRVITEAYYEPSPLQRVEVPNPPQTSN